MQLAKMQYTLPRMARMWSHLDRQGGGSGGGKGGGGAASEGENKLRLIGALLEKKLIESKPNLKSSSTTKTQRKERNRADLLMQQSWATQRW